VVLVTVFWGPGERYASDFLVAGSLALGDVLGTVSFVASLKAAAANVCSDVTNLFVSIGALVLGLGRGTAVLLNLLIGNCAPMGSVIVARTTPLPSVHFPTDKWLQRGKVLSVQLGIAGTSPHAVLGVVAHALDFAVVIPSDRCS